MSQINLKLIINDISVGSPIQPSHGFALLINDELLFDTGSDPETLLSNMRNMQIDIQKINTIFLSHPHFDHTGGIEGVLALRSGIKVYACPGFDEGLKDSVRKFNGIFVENKDFTKIGEGVYTTGEIEGEYKGKYMPEQSLLLSCGNGIVIVTGCAHPGIVNIIERAKDALPGSIRLVIGGFHLGSMKEIQVRSIVDKTRVLGCEKVAPVHCTGEKAQKIFQEVYGDNFINVKAGQTIEL